MTHESITKASVDDSNNTLLSINQNELQILLMS